MAFRPAHLIIRYRWTVLALWTLSTVLAVPRAAVVHEALSVEGAMIPDSDSELAAQTIRQAFPRPVADFFAVTVTGPVAIDSAQYLALLDSLSQRATNEPYISHVISYLDTPDSTLVSPDRKTTFMVAALRTDNTLSNTDYVPQFREAVHGTIERISWGAEYRANVTGAPALDYDVRQVSKEDTDRGERRSLPFSAIILVMAFGAFLAALLPLGIGIIAIVTSLALVQIVAGILPMSVFVLTIVSMVGLGVGIDYSLLIVTRFREELNRGHSPRQAAIRTIETAGRAVVTSGLTVVVGFASLLITPLTETRSVGIGGLIVVAAAVLLSVTLLPAALSILGRSIDWPRWLAKRLSWYHAPTGWERWARWLGHHPWRAITMGMLAVAIISYPLTQIKIGLPRAGWFPSGTESNAGVEDLERVGAQGVLQPVRVVVQAPAGEARRLVALSPWITAPFRLGPCRPEGRRRTKCGRRPAGHVSPAVHDVVFEFGIGTGPCTGILRRLFVGGRQNDALRRPPVRHHEHHEFDGRRPTHPRYRRLRDPGIGFDLHCRGWIPCIRSGPPRQIALAIPNGNPVDLD